MDHLTKEMKNIIMEIERYLHHNTDELCGDDLVGDGKRTKEFKEIILKIDQIIMLYNKRAVSDLYKTNR